MIDPIEKQVITQSGEAKTYTLTKFPATVGREIFLKYPLSNVPKLGEYQVSQETMLKLMSYVYVTTESGAQIQLKSEALLNNHVPDWETLVKLEYMMLEYNGSFFQNGKALGFLSNLAKMLQESTTKTLTDSLAKSSQAAKQH